ncbi:MAG: hypothetical protein ACJAZM_000605 [Cyclobacteriaceae bacterium]|jgi:hypothetical protein
MYGQTWVVTDSLRLSSNVTCICVGYQGNVYIGTATGEIIKLPATNKEVQKFSFQNLGAVTSISCQNPLKIVSFHQDTQSYVVLERFNAQPTIYEAPTVDGSRIEFFCLTPDQAFWSIESPDLLLRKRSNFGSEAFKYELTAILGSGEQIRNLVPYENGVALFSSEKLRLISAGGQTFKTIPLEKDANTYLAGNQLYSITDGELKVFSITGEEIKRTLLPTNAAFAIIRSNELIIAISTSLKRYSMR